MHLGLATFILTIISLSSSMSIRDPKNLPYFDYLAPEEYDYDVAVSMENDISRALPKRKLPNSYNSPIYYIRLPPQPYMFVPGLGYISQPPPPPPVSQMSQFVPVPVDFVANGKPSNIYQWASGVQGFENEAPKPPRPQKKPAVKPPKPQKPDSAVHNLGGEYVFNGKPDNIFVLRDSYNALYGDALQNFYP